MFSLSFPLSETLPTEQYMLLDGEKHIVPFEFPTQRNSAN